MAQRPDHRLRHRHRDRRGALGRFPAIRDQLRHTRRGHPQPGTRCAVSDGPDGGAAHRRRIRPQRPGPRPGHGPGRARRDRACRVRDRRHLADHDADTAVSAAAVVAGNVSAVATTHGSRASLDKDPREVASMFDGVAERYDLTNTVLSFGQDRGWRRATRAALDLKPGERVLDLAAGTGVSTVELGRSGAWVVATDFSTGMLKAGSFRQVPMVAGDAMKLPFADAVFDAATISFGLRNVSDFDAGLREIARVTRPGGTACGV
ncbi:methyltransferase domain-containing protein [Rhodococcus zopfii]|uniref:Methyltransferase domain-containing protein n=1 Tax=Rhodococcus zopfii TaxID=43772 RepID=A0ABU3WKV0_9NOCA|nr:methyltransferase domain-containing protein [Rhodococcus zopfii]